MVELRNEVRKKVLEIDNQICRGNPVFDLMII